MAFTPFALLMREHKEDRVLNLQIKPFTYQFLLKIVLVSYSYSYSHSNYFTTKIVLKKLRYLARLTGNQSQFAVYVLSFL